MNANRALAGGAILLDDLRAGDVGRHQVGRELDAVELADGAPRASVLISSVFARPGTPRSRQWPPAKNADQDLVNDRLLADDDAAQLVAQPRRQALRIVEGQHRRRL